MIKKNKRFTAVFCALSVLLACVLMTGCLSVLPSDVESLSGEDASAAEGEMLEVTITNGTDFDFYMIYVSPSIADDWGEDRLDYSQVLEPNGSITLTLGGADGSNAYDMCIMDGDEDQYEFYEMGLDNGAAIAVTYSGGKMKAKVDLAGGGGKTYFGTLDANPNAQAAAPDAPSAVEKAPGEYSFTITNNSDATLSSVLLGRADGDEADDINLLSGSLAPGASITVSGKVKSGDETATEWTLYVEDTDGKASGEYDLVNPFTVRTVTVTWAGEQDGFLCTCGY